MTAARARPGAAAAPRARTLRLARPAARRFPDRPVPPPNPLELRFMSEFLALFGEKPDLDLYARGGGHSFTEMLGRAISS